jgi:hypothetical protein
LYLVFAVTAMTSVFFVVVTVIEAPLGSMAVSVPEYEVVADLVFVVAGVGVAGEVEGVEVVWAWRATGEPARAKPRMAARTDRGTVVFIKRRGV